MSGFAKEFKKGIVISNPVFVLALSLCPVLAVTNTLDKAIGMSGAFALVIIASNLIISLMRKMIPDIVRILVFIIIIATFVSIVEMLFQAYIPTIYSALGIYLSLLAVNCLILGRAEAFASKNKVSDSLADALGMSIGFCLALILISFFRELLGKGGITIFGNELFTLPVLGDHPISVFGMSIGAFLVMGLLVAFFKWIGVIKDV
ncbi:MAG: electron transport complex subunit RsxE [Dehalococcoidales bacterium]|nr:electron transport complex subunit RsxE [Dehalococcoidales bacterium]